MCSNFSKQQTACELGSCVLIVLLLIYSDCKSFLTKEPLSDERANRARLNGYVCGLPESQYQIWAEPVQVALVERSNMSRRFHLLDSVSPRIIILLHSSNWWVIVAVIVLLRFILNVGLFQWNMWLSIKDLINIDLLDMCARSLRAHNDQVIRGDQTWCVSTMHYNR